MIEAVVLDLDDTIYLERDYVRSGFSSVAERLEELDIADADEVFEQLWRDFEDGLRGDAFDRLALRHPFEDRTSVPELVSWYRSHRPVIQMLDPAAIEALASSSLLLGLISDGDAQSQTLKMQALGLDATFDIALLTGAWGRDYWKPHPRAFELMETKLGLTGDQLVYVADNPTKDFITPNERGWISIRVRFEGQLHYLAEPSDREARPRTEVSSLQAVLELVGLGDGHSKGAS